MVWDHTVQREVERVRECEQRQGTALAAEHLYNYMDSEARSGTVVRSTLWNLAQELRRADIRICDLEQEATQLRRDLEAAQKRRQELSAKLVKAYKARNEMGDVKEIDEALANAIHLLTLLPSEGKVSEDDLYAAGEVSAALNGLRTWVQKISQSVEAEDADAERVQQSS